MKKLSALIVLYLIIGWVFPYVLIWMGAQPIKEYMEAVGFVHIVLIIVITVIICIITLTKED
jgi:hypothetical protein